MPDADFLVTENERITFARFDDEVDRVADGLLAAGFGKGDHVALWITNDPDWVRMLFAAARIGMVVIPINTRYKSGELEYILRQSDARALLMMDTCWGIDYPALLGTVIPDLASQRPGNIRSDALPELRAIFSWGDTSPPGAISINSLLERPANAERVRVAAEAVRPEDPVLICYTSGTTGRPKGAVHSHAVVRQSINVAHAMGMKTGDAVLGHMPFYHVAGLFMGVLPAVIHGMSLIVMRDWNADRALDHIEAEKIAHFGGIPTHFLDCFDAQEKRSRDLSSVRAAWIGGAAVSPEVVRRAREVFSTPHILASYGMTETTISTTFTRYDDPPEIAEANIGKLAGDYEARIVDPSSGATLGAGEIGELQVRGHIVTLGYYKNPEATREAITPEGWFRTGDLGVFDERGYLKITGRIKEMFIVGGSNTYPAEIEAHLETHPAIRQALVVGVPHERLGQVAYAYILRSGDAETFDEQAAVDHCRGAIADYKVPRYVRFVDAFPMTESGKIQRHVLASQAEAEVAGAKATA
ncbi:AMP-binding protein [Roseovarius amoyensis]|uniref:AMP-binding protein n=1 Tax=Roseovarius amoyensis TaxID=2211448 RepID=UPI0013A708AA